MSQTHGAWLVHGGEMRSGEEIDELGDARDSVAGGGYGDEGQVGMGR